MDLDIKRAFLSPFLEKKWFVKLVFPFIISACFLIFDKNLHASKLTQAIAVSCLAIPYLILWGFFTQFQHNEIHNKSEILPMLNNKLKDYLIYGLQLTGISLVYIIFLAIISIMIIPFFIFKINAAILTLLIIMYICVVLFLMATLIFSECSFADNFHFKDAFNFSLIFQLMSNAKLEILTLFLFSALLSIVLKLILTFTNFILIFYPFLRILAKLMGYNLAAQMYKIAKKRLQNLQK